MEEDSNTIAFQFSAKRICVLTDFTKRTVYVNQLAHLKWRQDTNPRKRKYQRVDDWIGEPLFTPEEVIAVKSFVDGAESLPMAKRVTQGKISKSPFLIDEIAEEVPEGPATTLPLSVRTALQLEGLARTMQTPQTLPFASHRYSVPVMLIWLKSFSAKYGLSEDFIRKTLSTLPLLISASMADILVLSMLPRTPLAAPFVNDVVEKLFPMCSFESKGRLLDLLHMYLIGGALTPSGEDALRSHVGTFFNFFISNESQRRSCGSLLYALMRPGDVSGLRVRQLLSLVQERPGDTLSCGLLSLLKSLAPHLAPVGPLSPKTPPVEDLGDTLFAFPTAAWKWWRGRDVLRRGRALEGAGEAASMAIMAIRRIVGQIKNLKQDEVTQRGAYLMSDAYGLALDAARLGLPAAPRSDTAAKYSKKRHSIIPKMTFNRMSVLGGPPVPDHVASYLSSPALTARECVKGTFLRAQTQLKGWARTVKGRPEFYECLARFRVTTQSPLLVDMNKVDDLSALLNPPSMPPAASVPPLRSATAAASFSQSDDPDAAHLVPLPPPADLPPCACAAPSPAAGWWALRGSLPAPPRALARLARAAPPEARTRLVDALIAECMTEAGKVFLDALPETDPARPILSPSIPPSVQALYRTRVPPPAGTGGERGGSAASERGTGTVSGERLQVLSDLLAITLLIAKEDGRPLDVYRCALDIRRKYRLPIYVPLDKSLVLSTLNGSSGWAVSQACEVTALTDETLQSKVHTDAQRRESHALIETLYQALFEKINAKGLTEDQEKGLGFTRNPCLLPLAIEFINELHERGDKNCTIESIKEREDLFPRFLASLSQWGLPGFAMLAARREKLRAVGALDGVDVHMADAERENALDGISNFTEAPEEHGQNVENEARREAEDFLSDIDQYDDQQQPRG